MTESNTEKKYLEREHNWKELLYTLFYEIKSEILGDKIELEEDEYQENVRTITIPNLVSYIHDSIQILILKKIEDTKEKQKEEDEKYYLWKYNDRENVDISTDQRSIYENIIKNLENRERKLVSQLFQIKLRNDAMENKIGEYMEIENEFEEMKAKYKYEEGRFLENDKKENEVIIIRSENANLKNMISKLEQQIKKNKEIQESKDILINNLKEEIKNFEKNKCKLDIKNNINNSVKDLSGIITNFNSGINLSNNLKMKHNKSSNNNIYSKHYYRNSNYINDDSNVSTREKFNITDRLKRMNSTIKHFQLSKYKNNKKRDRKNDLLSTTRNESFDRIKDEFLKKYISGTSTIRGTINTKNRSRIKISNLPLNSHKIKLANASAYIPFVNSRRNLNNFFSMKKIFGVGGVSSSKSSSKKKKTLNSNKNNGINFKSISCN